MADDVTDYDVAVVGGGPSGSTTAYHLARNGARVVVFDRAEFPRDKPCGGGITGRAWAAAPVDLTPMIEQEVDTVRFSYRLGSFFDYHYPRTLVRMTQRRRLDAFLLEHARNAGATVRESTHVRAIEAGIDSIQVQFDGGAVTAKAVVGADGSTGAVARSAGLAPAPEPPVALEAFYPYRHNGQGAVTPPEWEGVLGLELGSVDGGYGWSFPKADHFNVGCGGFHTEGRRLRAHLNLLAQHYGVSEPSEAPKGHQLPTRVGDRPITAGRVVLVGDAAGLVDPMSGEGIFAAFTSGRLAADAAGDFLRGRTSALMSYERAVERELMPDIRAATLLRDAYHWLPGPSYALMRHSEHLRRALCRLMLGEITYDGFLRRGGPLRPVLAAVAAMGRRARRKRIAARQG